MKKPFVSVFFVMSTSLALAQTTYDSKTLVDTNNTSTSTSTVNSNSTTNNVSTSTATSTVNSTSNNTNVNNNTSTNTNYNVNSGTQTFNNNNVNTGTMTYNNNNVSTSTATSVNTNNNNTVSTNTNNNVNTGDMTNRNINTSTSTSNNNNVNSSTSSNVNQNVNTGDMTNRNINSSDITQRVIQPPPTAIAPAMMSGGNNDLCTTGTSGAVQTQILGVSSGTTVRDMNCERLKLSKTLFDMGMKVAAVATMCQDRRVFDAMLQAGTPCPFEGKIGEAAKAGWEANPNKIPKIEEVKTDDIYKKIGLGTLLGIAVYKLFGF